MHYKALWCLTLQAQAVSCLAFIWLKYGFGLWLEARNATGPAALAAPLSQSRLRTIRSGG